RTMTLYFDKVPLQEAIDNLFKANSLSYEFTPDSNVIIVKDMGKPEIELETRVFNLKYASVSSSHIKEEMQSNLGSSGSSGSSTSGTGTTSGTTSSSSSNTTSTSGSGTSTTGDRYAVSSDIGITTAIKKLMTKDGSVIEDYRTNSLVVQDIPSRMPVIAETIAKLDVQTPLVRIEVEMLDVSKSLVDAMGLKFGKSPFTMVFTGPKLTGTTIPIPGNILSHLTTKVGSVLNSAGSVDFSTATYSVILDFLKTQTDAKFLARPNILTLNNETAEFKIETNETVSGVTSSTTPPSGTTTVGVNLERQKTGITLRVTPQINSETGEITMFVMPSVKETSSVTVTPNTGSSFSVKDPEERSTKAIVRVKDGETMILGGLIRNKKNETITKLPFFGDIPMIGGLFRNRTTDTNIERELLVFITPHIVQEGKTGLTKVAAATTNLPKFPEREQNTFSLAERQGLIQNKMGAFERKK
ncbi:MAG: secretin N-terminal domain-containing protein, partial [Candidatus Omnitrophica bacterium]|nr:secretin N-terminal domain-containing protein [Candidatus Omnitrophota bacterium]